MVNTTNGSSLSAASAIASCMSATPWPAEPVRGAGPRPAAAPRAMFTASISLAAFMHDPHRPQALGHALQQTGERQHRVAGEEPAPDVDRGLGDRLVALAEHERHGQLTSSSTGLPT